MFKFNHVMEISVVEIRHAHVGTMSVRAVEKIYVPILSVGFLVVSAQDRCWAIYVCFLLWRRLCQFLGTFPPLNASRLSFSLL